MAPRARVGSGVTAAFAWPRSPGFRIKSGTTGGWSPDRAIFVPMTIVFGHALRVRAAIDERETTMIYNMRIYDLKPGCVPQYMDAVREVALKIRQENGVKLAGWYYTDIGKLNRVVHIWAYDDLAHFDKARTAVTSDPRWARDFVSRVQGLIVRQQDMIMKGADFFEGPQ